MQADGSWHRCVANCSRTPNPKGKSLMKQINSQVSSLHYIKLNDITHWQTEVRLKVTFCPVIKHLLTTISDNSLITIYLIGWEALGVSTCHNCV